MKICNTCKEEKELDQFYPNGQDKEGNRRFRPKCRACEGTKKAQEKKKEYEIEGVSYRLCVECKIVKPINSDFVGGRSLCINCKKEQNKNRREQKKKENIVLFKCKEMAYSAHSRVFAPSRKSKTCYRSLENPFEFDSQKHLMNYLYENFYDEIKTLIDSEEIPTIDRIDSTKGYAKDNIRVISFMQNSMLGLESAWVTIRRKNS